LYGRITPDLAASGGIHKGTDVVRLLMAGARVKMVVSAFNNRLIVLLLARAVRQSSRWVRRWCHLKGLVLLTIAIDQLVGVASLQENPRQWAYPIDLPEYFFPFN
jgi:hypothetical protein